MKNALLIIILVVILCSCKSSKSFSITQSEDDYILAYKKSVLYGCINESTANDFYKLMEENNDLGLATETEILGKIEVTKLTQIGSELSKKIRTIDYADYEGRKPIFSNCVEFAFSKEIDLKARESYRKAKTLELEQ